MEINYLNLQKAAFEGVGAYDIPLLSPETFTDCELIGFNQAKPVKNVEIRRCISFYMITSLKEFGTDLMHTSIC